MVVAGGEGEGVAAAAVIVEEATELAVTVAVGGGGLAEPPTTPREIAAAPGMHCQYHWLLREQPKFAGQQAVAASTHCVPEQSPPAPPHCAN